MEAFLDCHSCAGFIPSTASACPHCGEAVPNKRGKAASKAGLLGTVATAAAGGLMSITLMACYGIAYTCEGGEDKDGDGFVVNGVNCSDYEIDCDDADENIHPGAEDVLGDGIDQNCDGVDGNGGSGGGGGTGGTGGTGGAGGTGGTGGGTGGSSTTTST